jgi:hypothetical protein
MNEKEHNPEDHFEKLKAKLFDEKEFNTMIIGGPTTSKAQGKLHELILAIANNELTSEEKEESLKLIKEKNGKDTLLSGIKKVKDPAKKALLTAACWETGMDCTSEFLFFVELACNDDFRVALEAYTVIENMGSAIRQEDIGKARKMVTDKIKKSPDTLPLLEDLNNLLESLLK